MDNTSAFRMDADTPLVVPEVNPEAVKDHSVGVLSFSLLELFSHVLCLRCFAIFCAWGA